MHDAAADDVVVDDDCEADYDETVDADFDGDVAAPCGSILSC